MDEDRRKEFKVRGEELLKTVKDLIHEGNIRRIIIKSEEGNTFMEIPLTVGLIGALLAPVLVAVGALAGLAGVYKIEIVRKDDPDERKIDE